MRIVSLNCSNTEIVCALGCADRLVGVDDDSDYPAEVVAGLPRVGRDLDIDIDKVRALEPDLVLASLTVPGHEKVVAAIDAAGLDYLAPEPVSLADIYRDIQTIATRLDVADRAATLIADLERELVPSRHATTAPTVLIQWWPKPVIAPGRLSWASDLIALAGGRNPLAEEAVKSRPLEDADVARMNPDAIVIAWCGVRFENYRPEVVYRNAAFEATAAVQKRRVYPVSEAFLGRPSPRVVEGYRALKRIVDTVAET